MLNSQHEFDIAVPPKGRKLASPLGPHSVVSSFWTQRPLTERRESVGYPFAIQSASSPQGVARLKEAVRNVPVTKEIVVYCGCCPWDECPNVAPAMKTLRALGYKDVKALYIPENFEADWMAKGYPTDSRRSVKGR